MSTMEVNMRHSWPRWVSVFLCWTMLQTASCQLAWWGSHVCKHTRTDSYVAYTTYYYSCGLWDWSTCSGKSSHTAYTDVEYYQCCTGWTQANGYDSSCNVAKCYGYTDGTCANNGVCSSPDSCSCPRGNYQYNCEDIKECDTNNGGCSEYCNEQIGNFYCSCYSGRGKLSDGKTCAYLCHGQSAGTCKNEGTCIQTDTCSCAHGWAGADCSDYNECLFGNGGCSQTCTNKVGGFDCSCGGGAILMSDEVNCAYQCFGQPLGTCKNGGTCVGPDDCKCAGHYAGSDCSKLNLARNGTATQSSLHSSKTLASKAIDGNTDGNMPAGSCTHTLTDYMPWWILELQGSYLIKSVRITNRADCCASRLHDFTITMSRCLLEDGIALGDPLLCKQSRGPAMGDSQSFTCSPAVYAKYIKVHIDANEILTLCEVEVFGEKIEFKECSVDNGGCAHICTDTECGHDCSCDEGWTLRMDGKSCRRSAGVNIAFGAPCTGSNSDRADYSCIHAVDGSAPSYHLEWKTVPDERGGKWIKLMFQFPFKITLVRLQRSATVNYRVSTALLMFEDGTEQQFGALSQADWDDLILAKQPFSSWIKIHLITTVWTTSGFAEIEVYAAGVQEVSLTSEGSTCSESSKFDFRFDCTKALDENLIEHAWASKFEGIGAWIKIVFDTSLVFSVHTIQRAVTVERNKEAQLAFSDGSTETLFCHAYNSNGYPVDGIYLDPPKTVTYVLITITSVYTKYNNGWTEISIKADLDECAKDNGGCVVTCENTIGSFICSCNIGYELKTDGVSCQDTNECNRYNGGCAHICTNSEGSFSCSCNQGYVLHQNGQTCDDVDECKTNNGGCTHDCANSQGSFSCSCWAGYSSLNQGITCSDINECSADNGECEQVCTNNDGSFSCSCNGGYASSDGGVTCYDINECSTNNGGCSHDCANLVESFQCSCDFGYYSNDGGTTCLDTNECDTNNGGCNHICVNEAGSHSCSCFTGYSTTDSGLSCTDDDECSSGAAECSQLCTNTRGSFQCSCQTGYVSGDGGVTCVDDNECERDNGGCSQDCGNTEASFICSCITGYTLLADLKYCQDNDECQTDIAGCSHICQNTAGSFSCSCNLGHSLDADGTSCSDIDECGTDTSECSQNCHNNVGSFTCSCDSGYDLLADSKSCEDIDECSTANGGCSHDCTNLIGGYDCSCNPGYSSPDDGTTCHDINECDDGKMGGCSHTCTNRAGDFLCSCYSNGYESSDGGITCTDIDECSAESDACSQICVNNVGSFSCQCNSGFLLLADKITCEDIDECLTDNGGCAQHCTNLAGSYQCSCDAGYTTPDDGETCHDVNECAANNGGCQHTCVNSQGSSSCHCDPGYTTPDDGKTCQDIDECLVNTGGCSQICNNTDGSHICSCNTGYNEQDGGVVCNDIDECGTNNGGCAQDCINSEGSFACECRDGYTAKDDGKICFDVAECDADNGGCAQDCTNSVGGYSCRCNLGYITPDDGITCDDVDECLTDKGGCDHNCHNTPGAFSCSCQQGYNSPDGGTTCIDINECDTNKGGCAHNCENKPGTFECSCDPGYSNPNQGVSCYDIDECATAKAGCDQNCHNANGTFSCSCRSGYFLTDDGATCEDVDECTKNNGNCFHNCTNSIGASSCSCMSGYSTEDQGLTCTDIDECLTKKGDCSHNCINSPGTHTCKCRPGYSTPPDDGKSCIDIDECLDKNGNCSHFCHNADGAYSCSCRPGYYSRDNNITCLDVNECATENGDCDHDCHNTDGSLHCTCRSGYDSLQDGMICRDVNECQTDNGGCEHNCHNVNGTQTCSCRPGYSTQNEGSTCEDIDECAADERPCSQNCHNYEGKFNCSCRPGYNSTDHQKTCIDINECSEGNGGCSQTCTNEPGSFFCKCHHGYNSPDKGQTCKDINECQTNNGGCSHDCTNKDGSHQCSCLEGYSTPDNGVSCSDNNECDTDNGGCAPGHYCINRAGHNDCQCKVGYWTDDDAQSCYDIDECTKEADDCAQICTNTIGAFACTCLLGYSSKDNGKTCFNNDECQLDLDGCRQGCTDTDGSFHCYCLHGYTLLSNGKSCEDIDECEDDIDGCAHNCHNGVGSFTCSCNPGYHLLDEDKSCQDNNECVEGNGGCKEKCINLEGSFKCVCNEDRAFDEDGVCKSKCYDYVAGTCGIGGTCRGHDTCDCKYGFGLPNCEDIDECAVHNGNCAKTCVNQPGSHYCTCPSGFMLLDDDSCEDINECEGDSDICSHTCVNTIGSFVCVCPSGYKLQEATLSCEPCSAYDIECWPECTGTNPCVCDDGFRLHEESMRCIASCPCEHGGVCGSDFPDYKCDCSDTDFKGDVCQFGVIQIKPVSFHHAGYGKTNIPVKVVSSKTLVLHFLTKSDLQIDPQALIIDASSGGGSFQVWTDTMGYYSIELTLTGPGAKLFEAPESIDVLAGDVFVRLQLSHKQLPRGCFVLDIDVPNTIFESTSEWYMAAGSDLILFTLGIPMTNGNGVYPISSRGVEITTSNNKIRMGPISPLRTIDGANVATTGHSSSVCTETELSSYDMEGFSSARSSIRTLLERINKKLPVWLYLEQTTPDDTSTTAVNYRADIARGEDMELMAGCSGVPVLPGTLYYVFQFSTNNLVLHLLGDNVVLPDSEYCFVVDSEQVDGDTLFIMFKDVTTLAKLQLFSNFDQHSRLGVYLTGIGFSSAGRMFVAEQEKGRALGFSGESTFWTHQEVISDNENLQISTSMDAFFDYDELEKIITHIGLEECMFQYNMAETIQISWEIELHGQENRLQITSSDEPVLVGTIAVAECGIPGKPLRLKFRGVVNGIIRGEGYVVSQFVFDPKTETDITLFFDSVSGRAITVTSEVENIAELVERLLQDVKSMLQTKKETLDDSSENILRDALLIVTELRMKVEEALAASLSVWDMTDIADTVSFISSAVNNLRTAFVDSLDHWSLTLQYSMGEALKSAIASLSELTYKANILSNRLFYVATDSISTKTGLIVNGHFTVTILDSALQIVGNLTYSQMDLCCETDTFCNNVESGWSLRFKGESNRIEYNTDSLWNHKLWRYFHINSGTQLVVGLAGTGSKFSVSLRNGTNLGLFYMNEPAVLELKNGGFTASATGAIFTRYPADVRLQSTEWQEQDNWHLTATVRLLEGDNSLSEEVARELRETVKRDINNSKERQEAAQASLRRAEARVEPLRLYLQEQKLRLVQLQEQLNDVTATLDDLSVKLNLNDDELNLDGLCEWNDCGSVCEYSSEMKLCRKQRRGRGLEYPCVKWDECEFSIGDISCYISNMVCATSMDYVLKQDVTNFEFYQLFFAYAVARKQAVKLSLKQDEYKMALQATERKYARARSDYNVGYTLVGAALQTLSEVESEIRSSLYISNFMETNAVDLLADINSCGFQQEITSLHHHLFSLQCKINFMQLGWKWYIFTFDFERAEASIQQTVSEIFKAFHGSVINILGPGIGRKKRAISGETASEFQQVNAVFNIDEALKDNEDSKCPDYRKMLTFLSTGVDILLSISEAFVAEVIAANKRFSETEFAIEVNSSLTLEDGDVNVTVAQQVYGVSREELVNILQDTDPNNDALVSQIKNSSKVIIEMNIDSVFAITHYDVLALWLTQMDNITVAEFNFSKCTFFQDCVRWCFDRFDELFALLDPAIVAQQIENMNVVSQLYEPLLKNEAKSMDEVVASAKAISNNVMNRSLDMFYCGTLPAFRATEDINITVIGGQNITLNCTASGLPTPTYNWWKFGDLSPLSNESTSPLLSLVHASPQSSGQYYCIAKNYLGSTISSTVDVTIVYPAVVTSELPSRFDLLVGDEVNMICETSGKPEPQVSWLTSSNVNISSFTDTFCSPHVDLSHIGLYYCQAENVYGRDQSNEAHIWVRGAQTMCPRIALKVGYIVRENRVNISNGILIAEITIEEQFVAAIMSIIQDAEGNLLIQDMVVVEEDYSIELFISVIACGFEELCSRSQCEDQYNSRYEKVQNGMDALLTAIQNDSLLFHKDNKAYYFNSALQEIVPQSADCSSGYTEYTSYICVNAQKVVYFGPPNSLMSRHSDGQREIHWTTPEKADAFIKGYHIEIMKSQPENTDDQADAIVNATSETTTYKLVDVLPAGRYRVRVRGFTSAFAGEWATIFVDIVNMDGSTENLWLMGVILAITYAGSTLLVLLFLVYRKKKELSNINPSRESSTASMPSTVSAAFSEESFELVPQKMKFWVKTTASLGSSGAFSTVTSIPSTTASFLSASTAKSKESVLPPEIPTYLPVNVPPECTFACREAGCVDVKPEDIDFDTGHDTVLVS